MWLHGARITRQGAGTCRGKIGMAREAFGPKSSSSIGGVSGMAAGRWARKCLRATCGARDAAVGGSHGSSTILGAQHDAGTFGTIRPIVIPRQSVKCRINGPSAKSIGAHRTLDNG
jgi:hypothetical protein